MPLTRQSLASAVRGAFTHLDKGNGLTEMEIKRHITTTSTRPDLSSPRSISRPLIKYLRKEEASRTVRFNAGRYFLKGTTQPDKWKQLRPSKRLESPKSWKRQPVPITLSMGEMSASYQEMMEEMEDVLKKLGCLTGEKPLNKISC